MAWNMTGDGKTALRASSECPTRSTGNGGSDTALPRLLLVRSRSDLVENKFWRAGEAAGSRAQEVDGATPTGRRRPRRGPRSRVVADQRGVSHARVALVTSVVGIDGIPEGGDERVEPDSRTERPDRQAARRLGTGIRPRPADHRLDRRARSGLHQGRQERGCTRRRGVRAVDPRDVLVHVPRRWSAGRPRQQLRGHRRLRQLQARLQVPRRAHRRTRADAGVADLRRPRPHRDDAEATARDAEDAQPRLPRQGADVVGPLGNVGDRRLLRATGLRDLRADGQRSPRPIRPPAPARAPPSRFVPGASASAEHDADLAFLSGRQEGCGHRRLQRRNARCAEEPP